MGKHTYHLDKEIEELRLRLDYANTHIRLFAIEIIDLHDAFDDLANDFVLNAEYARENGYFLAADVMQDAADYVLGKIETRRNQ